jgi:hypothetical protein
MVLANNSYLKNKGDDKKQKDYDREDWGRVFYRIIITELTKIDHACDDQRRRLGVNQLNRSIPEEPLHQYILDFFQTIMVNSSFLQG